MFKKGLLMFVTATVLFLTACTLAKPEVENSYLEDRFVGVYIVGAAESESLYDMEGWIPHGKERYEIGSVKVESDRLIFPGEYVQDELRYAFPGLKGYALFAAEAKNPGEDDPFLTTCSDLQNVSSAFHTVAPENGEEAYTDYELSGTLYVAESMTEDNYYRMLNVFQKSDGMIYLDGTGDAIGCSGGTFSVEMSDTRTVNGEKMEMGTTRASVTLEEAKEADSGVLYWYSQEGELLSAAPLDLKQITELDWNEKADWAVFEEIFDEEVVRTIIEKGTEEEPAFLTVATIDEDGVGVIKTVPLNVSESQ